MTRIPHWQNLYTFYLAGELGSFKAAADALFISSAAVSQQIRQLEDQLDTKLFERQHRKVTLTESGKVLHHHAHQGFSALIEGSQKVGQDSNPNSLSLSTLPSFAQHWLVPRLGDFSEANPDLSVLIMPKNGLVDFAKEQVDLCIRFGLGNYEDLESRYLMADHLYPVCHPLYLKEHSIQSLEDLRHVRLIEDARPDMSWQYWLSLADVDLPATHPTLRYHGAHMVIEGALSVQGVALVRHSLAWKFIEQGLLVQVGDIEVRSGYGYWLCAPAAYLKRPKSQLFAQWIAQQCDDFWSSSNRERLTSRKVIQAQVIDNPLVC